MKRVAAVVGWSLVWGGVAGSEPSPFAQSPASAGPTWTQMSLGNIMLMIQTRHARIWTAGRAQDWALVVYELDHIIDDLMAAGMLYRDIPATLVTDTDRVLLRMKDAAKRNDPAGFQTEFAELTNACNTCHAAGGVSFIRIQTPTTMPFTNQKVQASSPQ